jgi:hypothetical protein
MNSSIENTEAPRDLPPVEPPSAGFIIQLFVIPAIVVAVLIVVYLLFGRIAGGERSAHDYIQKIKSDSGDWRSAFELASLIQNDNRLANDPKLLGELTVLLATELGRKDSNPKLNSYLALALGVFQTHEARGSSGKSVDPLAVLALALAPGNDEKLREAAAESLARHGARMKGKLEHKGAVEALAAVAKDAERTELRQLATYALGFFGGDASAEALRERVRDDEDRPVRYNAGSALARRGDPAAYDILREMLSSSDLSQVIKSDNRYETTHRVEAIELEALHALQISALDSKPVLAERLRPDITALTKSDLTTVRTEAKALLKSLQDRRRP